LALLRIDNLSKTYHPGSADAVYPVAGVSLSADDGERVAITGPSGGGKTTLLMLIAGLLKPSGGSISLAGRDLDGVRPDKRNLAVVFQHDALYPHLSARKHLELSLRGAGVTRKQIPGRIAPIADRLGIAECLGRRPNALSGGQRRRVALARAMVRPADLVLLDEPLSGVDDEMSDQIRGALLDHWAQAPATVLIVTHDERTAEQLGQRTLIMRGGKLG